MEAPRRYIPLCCMKMKGFDCQHVSCIFCTRCLPLDEPIDLLNVAFEQPCAQPPTQTNICKANKNKNNKKNNRSKRNENEKSKDRTMVPDPGGEVNMLFSDLSNLSLDIAGNLENSPERSEVNQIGPVYSRTIIPGKSSEIASVITRNIEDHCNMDTDNADNDVSPLLKLDENEALSINSTSLPSHCLIENTHLSSSRFCKSPPPNTTVNADCYDVPDRKTGERAYLELCRMNHRRKWNFIKINVTQEELARERRERIQRLIYPLSTVLDDSIGCALWFAARGKGTLNIDGQEEAVISRAKVSSHFVFECKTHTLVFPCC